jgi:hypothetical protein
MLWRCVFAVMGRVGRVSAVLLIDWRLRQAA